MEIRVGDQKVTLFLTPGHTLGTISTLVPVKDRGSQPRRRRLGRYLVQRGNDSARAGPNLYVNSASRFRDIAAKAGADIIIANHTMFDGTKSPRPRRWPGAGRKIRTHT